MSSNARRENVLWESGLFAGVILLLIAVAPSGLFQDPGTFWHTRNGQLILESHQVPHQDTFSYSRQGEPWASQSWLCELAMAGCFRLGGWDLQLVVTAVLLAATFAWCSRQFIRRGLAGIISSLLVMIAFASAAPHFHIRPSTVSLPFMVALCSLMLSVESHASSLRRLWLLPPLFIAWTNIHAAALGGVATFLLVGSGWWLFGWFGMASPIRTAAKRLELVGIAAACVGSVLVNPYGLGLPQLWLAILRLPLSEFVMEHAPLTSDPATAIFPALLVAIYLLALLSVPGRSRRATWLLPLVWFALAWSCSRHVALFAVIFLTVFADLLPHSRLASWLARRGFFQESNHLSTAFPRRTQRAIYAAVFLATLGIALPFAAPTPGKSTTAADSVLARSDWPMELLPALQTIQQPDPNSIRILNDGLYGGFLIFYTPGLHVLIDDRFELFGETFLRRYLQLFTPGAPAYPEWDAQYHFTHALLQRETPIAQRLLLDPEWQAIGSSKRAILFARKISEASTQSENHPASAERIPASGSKVLPAVD